MQEAVDLIMRVYYKIMASQENARIGHGLGTGCANFSNGAIEDYSVMAEQRSFARNVVNEPSLQELEAIAAWSFENCAFGPADFELDGRT